MSLELQDGDDSGRRRLTSPLARESEDVALGPALVYLMGWRVRSRALMVMLLDQLSNAFFLAVVYLVRYLADVVLSPKLRGKDTSNMLLLPNRSATALILGFSYVVPSLVLLIGDCLETICPSAEGGGRRFLSIYINHSEATRSEALVQELMLATDVTAWPAPRKGCVFLLKLLKGLGKVVCMAAFMVGLGGGHSSSVLPLLIYVMAILLFPRHRRYKYTVVAAHTAVGVYIAFASRQVLNGELSLGEFLVTLLICRDLGNQLASIYDNQADAMQSSARTSI